ncbi:hypothetical protein [Butyrivibrio sp. WCE2006]|uniref:hypothetical protein n=1 Tax=Butyrivibrio sp. WCE2006 TaxID=1410611 RepID=UPI0005D1A80A|nr:hypothetical protein [Butyrivibrio sp. WCE2006]
MNKRFRQYIGIVIAIVTYYVVHEGAHLICAASFGVFKQIIFSGIGMEIDVYREKMEDSSWNSGELYSAPRESVNGQIK